MAEILTVDSYPDINWARIIIDDRGDPQYSYGLMGMRVGREGFRMNSQGQLVSYIAEGEIDSRLFWGNPGIRKLALVADSEKPFDLHEPKRINLAGELAREIITTVYQRETAQRVTNLGEELLRRLSSTVGWIHEETRRDAGIVDELVKRQKDYLLPERLLDALHRITSLGVAQIYEVIGFTGLEVTPNWLISKIETSAA